MLRLENLRAHADGKPILQGVSLSVGRHELVAIVGPNGSGKSTLARAIMGDPSLRVEGKIKFEGRDIGKLPPEERSRLGLFLSFQNPPELETIGARYFFSMLFDGWEDAAGELGIRKGLFDKDLFVGFSGGEKKKIELLQAVLKRPKLAIFDEIDSGLDVESLHMAAGVIKRLLKEGSVLAITHHARLFRDFKPDRVFVMLDGRLVDEGGPELLDEVAKNGFKRWRR